MAPVDRDKVRSHVDYVRRRVRSLREIGGMGRDRFMEDEILQGATIRYLHTAVEAMIDIANHVVAREGWGLPTSYAAALDLLVDRGVLPEEHRDTFRRMVRFRNRAVHLYDEIDEEEVFGILVDHLGDFDLFVSAIAERYLED